MIKKNNFSNRVIIIDGYNATGKTILPPILDSFKNTQLPTFSYELEWFSNLYLMEEISTETFVKMIKKIVDYRLYNGFIGRELNTRRGDLSSIWKSRKLFKLLSRIFNLNDNKLYLEGAKSDEILVLTITQAFNNFKIFSNALKKRLLFIEYIRDPLYMFLQYRVLHQKVIDGDPRKDFTIRYFDEDTKRNIPPYFKEYLFTKKNFKNLDSYLIDYFENLLITWEKVINENKKSKNLLILPFEQFVIKPNYSLQRISNFIGEDYTLSKSILDQLKFQNIPRKTLTAFKGNEIYQRYGFQKISSNNLKDEREKYMFYLNQKKGIENKILKRLNELSLKYYKFLLSINYIDQSNTPI